MDQLLMTYVGLVLPTPGPICCARSARQLIGLFAKLKLVVSTLLDACARE